MTLTAYEKVFQAEVDTQNAHTTALKERRAIEPQVKVYIPLVKDAVRYTLGKSNPVLTNFGIKPAKERTKLTAEELVARTEKANATREARGTKGPREMGSANPRVEVADVLELRAIA